MAITTITRICAFDKAGDLTNERIDWLGLKCVTVS